MTSELIVRVSHNQNYVLYYEYNQGYEKEFLTTASELQKCNILVIAWALVICLKYKHLHLGPGAPLACAYISGKSLMPVL